MAISLTWLQAKGAPYATMTNLTDAYAAYIKAKSSGTGTLADNLMKLMTSLGFTTGTINDRMLAFYRAKTGLPTATFGQAETAYFANNGLDYV